MTSNIRYPCYHASKGDPQSTADDILLCITRCPHQCRIEIAPCNVILNNQTENENHIFCKLYIAMDPGNTMTPSSYPSYTTRRWVTRDAELSMKGSFSFVFGSNIRTMRGFTKQ